MKVLLTVGVYLALVLVLGYVLALTAPRESFAERDTSEDEE